MKNLLGSAIFLLIATGAYSQRETRTIEPFTGLSVGESITVYLTKGSSNQARIETSGVNTDKVVLDNSGRTLHVHMKSGSWRSFNATVYLEFEELEELEVSSSADVIGKSTISGDELEIEVSSSGSAVIDVDVNRLDIDVSSSGKLEISGQADSQRVDANSSGKVFGFGLQSKSVRAQASSSGKIELSVSGELEAEANSAGRIRYEGAPDKLYVNSNSGGSIRKN